MVAAVIVILVPIMQYIFLFHWCIPAILVVQQWDRQTTSLRMNLMRVAQDHGIGTGKDRPRPTNMRSRDVDDIGGSFHVVIYVIKSLTRFHIACGHIMIQCINSAQFATVWWLQLHAFTIDQSQLAGSSALAHLRQRTWTLILRHCIQSLFPCELFHHDERSWLLFNGFLHVVANLYSPNWCDWFLRSCVLWRILTYLVKLSKFYRS